MNGRHVGRNFPLTLYYPHPATIRRGPAAAKPYLAEPYRCRMTDADVATLQGTSLGLLQVTADVQRQLSERLRCGQAR